MAWCWGEHIGSEQRLRGGEASPGAERGAPCMKKGAGRRRPPVLGTWHHSEEVSA